MYGGYGNKNTVYPAERDDQIMHEEGANQMGDEAGTLWLIASDISEIETTSGIQ